MKPIHCRLYGLSSGYCGRLNCARCGRIRANQLIDRVIAGSRHHAAQSGIWFVTFYWETREFIPTNGRNGYGDEKACRLALEEDYNATINKVMRSLKDRARREGIKPEYCIVTAYGKFWHKIHRWVHSHLLINWLPDDVHPASTRLHPDKYESDFVFRTAMNRDIAAWIEKPRSVDAVAKYTGQNLREVIGLELPKYKQPIKFSHQWDGERVKQLYLFDKREFDGGQFGIR